MAPADAIPLTESARLVLQRRYLQRDEALQVCESPEQMFRRVADAVAQAEADHGADAAAFADAAYAAMARLEFLPNSPTLMNAGLPRQQLAACFVLPVEDSLESIFDALKYTAMIHQSGGGTGFTFSHLRPANDIVHSTHGVASGPVSFMHVFDAATDAIKQGGRRRGANMAILDVEHPDIEAFIEAKAGEQRLRNFNLSVAVSDAFMEAADTDDEYTLINPRTDQPAGRRSAREIFDRLTQEAWRHGDPGLIFRDRINAANPTPQLGRLESTNPCGEQPLLPYESCTLGSIDVAKFARDGDLDWSRLGATVELATRFLDDVIDVNRYPSPAIDQATRATRKIGLGLMGFADLLYRLGLPYDSPAALDWAGRLMAFIRERADAASERLAEERGPFPAWAASVFAPQGRRLRNATRTTVAPTGTLSIVAGCSGGIEPVYAIVFLRHHYLDPDDPGALSQLTEVHPIVRAAAQSEGWWSDALQQHLLHDGALHDWSDAPAAAQRLYVTAHDIAPEWHVRMQAAFQQHVDNAVSKTINFPADATVDDIAAAYRLAWREGCKGITAYRDQSRKGQVLASAPSELDAG